jgi:hypothetical protein
MTLPDWLHWLDDPQSVFRTIASIGCLVSGTLLILLSLSGWVLTPKGYRTRFGTALSHVTGSLGTFLILLVPLMMHRAIRGSAGHFEPEWLEQVLTGGLMLSIVACCIASAYAYPGLIARYREGRLR